MKYSQNNEDQIISDYFTDKNISLLSIGENDGKTLSNVLRSIEDGANAVLVEPSLTAFYKMKELHKDNKRVQLFNVAIAEEFGTFDFFESGSHLGKGDTSLLSTLDEKEIDRWKASGEVFNKTKTVAFTFSGLLELCKKDKFDLISIDAEGYDLKILKQIDLTKIGCKMLIIETNGVNDSEFIDYCKSHKMKLYTSNHENLIFIKE